MRSRVAALAITVLTAGGMLAAFTPGPAMAQNSFGAFQAYANGTKQHVRVIDAPPPGGQTLANVDTSFSAAAANSQGLKPINNVFNEPAVPTTGIGGKNSYSRGAAVEAGIGANFQGVLSDPNQILLPKITEAAAAPSTGLNEDDLVPPVKADPLLYLSAATNKAKSVWNDNFCPLGQPISYGENDLANAQLLDAGAANPDGSMSQPVISETPSGDRTTTNFNQSYTYLFPTGPSTFGIGAANRQVLAPVTIGKGLAPGGADLAVLTLLGTWQLRVEDTGNGAPTVTYAAYDNLGNKLTGATPVATLTIAGTPVLQNQLTAQAIFGANGLDVDIPPGPGPYLAQVHIGTPPTAIAGKPNGFTTDAVLVSALNVPSQIDVADLRYGHMEAQAQAPAGGINCNIPVSKTFNDATGNPVSSISSGNNFTWKITFPTVDISKELACDLTNVKVTDVAKVTSGSTVVNITGASNGGQVTGATVKPGTNGGVTWNLGTYHPGDPPIVLTINGTIPPTSPAGVINNTANVTATLGNCTGGALGTAFVTNGSIGGKAATIQGSSTAGVGAATTSITGPAVKAGLLATTGQTKPWLPILGGGFMLGALGLMRSRRRLHGVRQET